MGTITVSGLGKAYKQYHSRWSRFAEWVSPVRKNRHELRWVLRDLSFTVDTGEAVGIIGINGAGKSTLLKIVTGTVQPTTGTVHITGRVAALLELGMGFHPDFTGRQNVYMAGQLLGLSAEQITNLMPAIEEFAEIGDYIDQPVRIYSSGMQVRLAFSVATAQRPDVLIVDEALSVGDSYFQHKSFARIREFRNLGTTLLIVSHDKSAIQSICSRAILLNAGQLAMTGDPEAVMDYYNALLADQQKQTIKQNLLPDGKQQTSSGTGEAVVVDLVLLDENSNETAVLNVGQRVNLRVKVKVLESIDKLVFGYSIKDRYGQIVYGTNTALKKQILHNLPSQAVVYFDIEFFVNLGPGTYSLQTALTSAETHLEKNYEWRDLALLFNVANLDKSHFVGVSWLDPVVHISLV
jgi:lipopolysaccharide transport system ATP-binding protein